MRKMLLLLLGVLLVSTQIFAQTRTVTGKVTDDKGNPLPNASVIVKGSSSGTTTDDNGAFSLTIPDNAKTLVISAIGMTKHEISIGSKTDFSVAMQPEDKSLQEVVVVGYGKTTKQAYTGSATVVKAEKLNNKSVSSLSQALAGEVAGVRVINTSGQPGTEATIRIRGFGSVNGNRAPLYVVDGVPFTGNVNAINMGDVESATVLKDATATAIYGARGANGVILITTKNGRGKSFIEVEGKIGTNRQILPRYDVIKSPEDFIGLGWESVYNMGVIIGQSNPTNFANARLFNPASNVGIDPKYNMWKVANVAALIDPVTRKVRAGVERKYTPENWEDFAFQSSTRQEVNIRMGGGDSKTSYFSSFGYLNDVGYSINSDFKRLTGRLNLTHEVKKWLSVNTNLSYANIKSNKGGQGSSTNSVFLFIDNMPSIYPLFKRDANGGLIQDTLFDGNEYDYGVGRGFSSLTNGIADAKYNTNRDDRHELTGNTSLNFKITKEISFESRLGIQYYNDYNIQRYNKFYGSSASLNGSLFSERNEMFNYNWLNMLRYAKRFNDHNIEVLVAHENTDFKRQNTTIGKSGLVSNEIEDFNNAIVSSPTSSYTDLNKLESYFGQVSYDYDGTYYVTGSFRRDGSSRFVKDKWGTFGSIGAGWVISNEGFMQEQKLFNYLKLKASYGLIGEQDGLGPWPGFDLFNIDNLNDKPAFSFNTKGNPDLTWETSKIFQAGLEFRLQNFLTGTIEYYVKNTDDLLFDRRVGPSIGYALIKVNGGQLRNQGIEFDLTGHILRKKDYYVDLTVNGEAFKNKLTAMPLDPVTKQEKVLDVQGNYGWATGHSIFDYYIRDFASVDPKDGTSQWTLYYDDVNNNNVADAGEGIASLKDFESKNPDKIGTVKKTTTKTWSEATLFYNGKSAIPKLRGAVILNAGYKGFDLSVQMLYSFGGYSYDGAYASLMHSDQVGSNNWHKDMFGRWQKDGDITNIPRLSNEQDDNVNSTSTRFLIKSDYLALNNIRLGYTLPASLVSRLFVSEATFWVSGDNLWLHSKRKGFNPSSAETGSSSVYRYSPLSTISAGLRVKF